MAAGETQQNKSDQQRAKDGTQAERPAGQDSFAQQDGGNQPDARAVGDPQQPRLRQRIFKQRLHNRPGERQRRPHQHHRQGSRQADLPDEQLAFRAQPFPRRDPLIARAQADQQGDQEQQR